MTPTFDAQCARCGQGESLHKPDVVGENRTVVLVCPELCPHGEWEAHWYYHDPQDVTAARCPGPAKPVER